MSLNTHPNKNAIPQQFQFHYSCHSNANMPCNLYANPHYEYETVPREHDIYNAIPYTWKDGIHIEKGTCLPPRVVIDVRSNSFSLALYFLTKYIHWLYDTVYIKYRCSILPPTNHVVACNPPNVQLVVLFLSIKRLRFIENICSHVSCLIV